jgi:ADP-ribose pyrophosphatase
MSELTEKTIASEPAYLGKLVKLYVDTVELPNGGTAKREVVRHPGAVAMVPLLTTGEVLLVRQYRVAAAQVLLEIPAGTLNPGEDPHTAATRELQEETGYRPGNLVRLGGEFTAPGYTTEFIHLYLATELSESTLDKDEDEFIEVVRMPLTEAIERIRHGEIQDGKTIIGLLLAEKYLAPK